jgi:acylphosphatase
MLRRDFLRGAAAMPFLARLQSVPAWDPPLHAMDTWFWREKGIDAPGEAALLKRLGYAGLALSWGQKHAERLRAVRDAGLAVPGIYVVADLDQDDGPLLKGVAALGVPAWLALTSRSRKRSDPSGDEAAASLARRWAGACPSVVLYPHVGFWMEKVSDAVRVAAAGDVGLQFNQYHWMVADGGRDLDALLETAGPRLKGVSINGSGTLPSILPLGEGDYDVLPLARALAKRGFAGPLSHQGYSIQGRLPERLEAAMKAWTNLKGRAQARAEDAVKDARAHVFVSGGVQGVGYRAWTDREASRRGLHGWVRNLDDGRVEALFQGPKDAVEAMVEACGRGPVSARVSSVEKSWEDPDPVLKGFSVRP